MRPPPPFSALKPGSTLVNIVLKADQPTGKLTTGIVADILTRGDHPRGVKVRLLDGRVGRVQRIVESGGGGGGARETGDLLVAGAAERDSGIVVMTGGGSGGGAERRDGGAGFGRARGREWERRDYLVGGDRLDEESGVVRGSLMDFVKPAKQRRRRGGGEKAKEGVEDGRDDGGQGYENGDVNDDDAVSGDDNGMAAVQQLLEKEFPNIDTALVAAILLDHEGDLGAARGTLEALK